MSKHQLVLKHKGMLKYILSKTPLIVNFPNEGSLLQLKYFDKCIYIVGTFIERIYWVLNKV